MSLKKRMILALPFKDRVVQHALNNIIEPVFEKCMFYDSYACRMMKGTHAAAKRLSYFMGKTNIAYYLKIDIKSYFASVNHNILKNLIKKRITDRNIIWLIDEILDSSPVPGLPIGNLLSQLFANILLHELDFYHKTKIGIKYYIRYMDDIIILASDKKVLKNIFEKFNNYIDTNLKLSLNPKSGIGRCKDGIEFVGYRVWRNLKLIKKQSLERMKKKIRAWKKNKLPNKKIISSMGSWMGHSLNTHSYRAVMRMAIDVIQVMAKRADNPVIAIKSNDQEF